MTVSFRALLFASILLSSSTGWTQGIPAAQETWETPPPSEQADKAGQLTPPAMGGIFVPAMLRSASEPSFRVFQNSEQVSTGKPGQHVFVAPGDYVVKVGSGATEVVFDARVVEGQTTFIPVAWGGLLVTIVDDRGSPFRGSYEVVRLPEREFVGLGIGAELAKGERLTAWSLPPGRYLLLSPGESYQARRNFITVRILPGELSQMTLVQDPANNDLLGGGEVSGLWDATELEGWDVSLIVGGSLEFSRTDEVIEKTDGSYVNVEAFLENLVRYNSDTHFAYSRLYLEESSREIKLPDNPYLKNDDELRLDVLYAYRVTPWFGPYVRTGVQTHVLPSILEFENPRDVQRVSTDGTPGPIEPGRDYLRLAPPFSNVRTRFGSGARFEGHPAQWLEVYSLFGLAARHIFTNDLYVDEDDEGTQPYEIRRKGQNTLIGLEGALVGKVNITRWVLWQIECDLLSPVFSIPDRDKVGNPVIGVNSTVSLRLASFASLNYVLDVERDPALSAKTQLEQALLLRFAYKFF